MKLDPARKRRILSLAAILVVLLGVFVALLVQVACRQTEPFPPSGDRLPRRGDEIVVCGQLFHTGTRVVLWNDPHGYDAYRLEPRFPELIKKEQLANFQPQSRYSPIRTHVPENVKRRVADRGWTLEELQDAVDLFVVHFDACGTSRRCFRVLHDERFLSVHFLLDADGTIYQTMDLKERAYHARHANDRSIGVEIAHVGAYRKRDDPVLKTWYADDASGTRLTIPKKALSEGVAFLDEDASFRPARSGILTGDVHGVRYYQYDFTPEQYLALSRLLVALNRALPRIRLDVPRDRDGSVVTTALDDSQLARFSGILGHYHVTREKIDPGPAFDWERILTR
jgi:N-acetylmuramoyl-L-alanine amidase